jgi:diguanylate cyclase (GGDEF)-like protein/PAS domain S-box-containing protein
MNPSAIPPHGPGANAAQQLAVLELQLRAKLDALPDLFFECDLEGRYFDFHSPFTELLAAPIESFLGKTVTDVMPSETASCVLAGLQEAQAQGSSHGRQICLELPQGRRWFELSIAPKALLEGEDQRFIVLSRDITERKQETDFEASRSHVLEMLSNGAPVASILETLVRGVETVRSVGLCSILMLDEAGKCIDSCVAPSLPDFYNAALKGLAIGPGVGSCGTAAFTGERVVVEDIASHPYWAPFKDLAASAGLGSCWSQPIRVSSGKVLGTFAIYHSSSYCPSSQDIAIIEKSAHLAAIAIERGKDAQVLRDSEAHFRLLTEEVSDVVWKLDRHNVFTYISPADERMRGFKASEVVGRHVFALFTPEGIATINRILQERKAANLHASPDSAAAFEVQQHCKDGSLIWTEILSVAERDSGGNITGYHGITRNITAQKVATQKLQLAASVFSHALEGILITTLDGTIIDVNSAFSQITGYSREDVLGLNPRILSSGRQDKDFYTSLFLELGQSGNWHGEVWNRRKNGEVYAQSQTISVVHDADGKPLHYVALFSDITHQKAYQSQLEHIAHFDALTGLPNRVLLADRLQHGMTQALRRGEPLAVAFLDLDGFKAVNDQHGHGIGDQLLIALAARMKMALRDGDTLARLGGDEFVAVLVDLEQRTDSVPLITRLLAAAAHPVHIGDLCLQVSASAGVTLYPQAQEVDADQLMRQADQAMYQAKLAGKNRYHLFDASLDSNIRGQHESIDHIRQALERREFVLHYQPKVNMRTGSVIGAEALIRWQHPQQGLLPPSAFLPVIEDHPLAVEVGNWVIDAALQQMHQWQENGFEMAVSINISARQLQHPDFIGRLGASLAAHAMVAPERLELEILETSALQDLAQISELIRTCATMGISFALDDFGTGYSSLTYLKHLPVTMLKIDQSFVRSMLDDTNDLAILEGVIGLASAFRRHIIAEGVETAAHGTLLLQLGCDLGQGYGIARPMPADQLPGWASQWQPDPSWKSLKQIRREDYPILFAGVEHKTWSQEIENYLCDHRATPPDLDALKCHFGQWLSGDGRARFGDKPSFVALSTLHQQAHQVARHLCGLRNQGQTQEIQQQLGELHLVRDQLLEQVRSLLENR